jgi:hypothetical protein
MKNNLSDDYRDVVMAGGVLFKCDECHANGVIYSGDYTERLRQVAKKPIPEICGIHYEKCLQHKHIELDINCR